jgi:ubiquinone/menaquinone biosynthesis C-methylase UbiE
MTWQQGDAAALPLPSAAFDVVLCQQGLQYFQQRAAALMEMKRVLVPGGRLALSVWRPIERQPFFMVLVDVIGPAVVNGQKLAVAITSLRPQRT